MYYNKFEAKGSENHYKFQSNLRKDKDVLKEFKNNKKTGIISYLLLVLALVLPGFIYMNKNKKIFLKNLFLWVVMVGIVMLGYLYQK